MTQFAVLLAGTASAATYYVSTSGNDANPGTLAAPFRTISKGAGAARAGDVVNVRAGVYPDVVKIGANGTAAAPITIQPYPGEAAVIDGSSTATGTDLVTFASSSWVNFSGFEIRNSRKAGIVGWGVNNLRITDNDIHDSVRNGIYMGYSSMGSVSNITIDGNSVHNNVLENQTHSMTGGGWAQAIGVQYTQSVRITHNRVFNNDGEGIIFILSNGGFAQGNEVFDNFSVEMYLDNATNTTLDSNLVYSTGNTRYYRDGFPASGISAANESYSTSNPINGDIITNNIVLNGRWGFYYGSYGIGGGLKNVTIANNTFYKAAGTLLSIDNGPHSGSVIENNIFDQVGAVMTAVAGSGITYRNNNWFGGTAGGAAGTGDVLADPRLASPGTFTADAYRLTIGSPVLAAGISLPVVTTDYFGVARGVAFDIGASQLSTGSGAAADTQAPTVPAGLTASATSSSGVHLAWNASTDNVAVIGYKVSRNGVYVTSVLGTSYDDGGLAASTSYSYSVSAYDGAGNQSAASPAVSLSTLPSGALPGGGDTQAPTTPANLVAVATSSSAITLTWSASSDNVGVSGYDIFRGGVKVATVTGTSWSDQGLAGATGYTYDVVAFDAAGNQSGASNLATAVTAAVIPATPPPPAPDTQAPTAPASLRTTSVTSTAASLAWNASSDNVGVAGYRVYRNGSLVATVSATSWTDATLHAVSSYTYTVAAFDAAGNQSAASNSVTIRTAKAKQHSVRH